MWPRRMSESFYDVVDASSLADRKRGWSEATKTGKESSVGLLRSNSLKSFSPKV